MTQQSQYLAPSKINLGLEILARRSDGYHELNSIFCQLSEPHDTLRILASDCFELSSDDSSLPMDSSNLVHRAALAFAQESGAALQSIHIHLEKRIPTGAGLGGGSSDAATTLLLLNDRFENKLSNDRLHDLAKSLGADVPFFLSGYRAGIATGIGDTLRPVALSIPYPILVVKLPTISVDTKGAYKRLNLNGSRRATEYESLLNGGFDLAKLAPSLRNDFEPSIFSEFPALGEVKSRLITMGAIFASMTGSGSAIFGIFEDERLARLAEVAMRTYGAETFYNPPE